MKVYIVRLDGHEIVDVIFRRVILCIQWYIFKKRNSIIF